MMFAEYGIIGVNQNDPVQVRRDSIGRDLIWNPTSTQSDQFGRNFIYVTNTQYDEGRQLGMSLDSAKYENSLLTNQNAQRNYIQKHVFDKVTWVGYPRLAPNAIIRKANTT